MAAAADKFARLAALKPTRPLPARPAAIRTPGEEDVLGRLLGAGVASNPFGEHLAVRNWFSTPEFSEPSSTTLELLSRTRDESIARKTRAALEDPEKWLFLDTETTGLAGGTGTYAFLIGLAWWDAGGLQAEQFFMRDFAEEHALLHELSQRVAERPVLVTFNGKSFDWPLLENRFTMTRSIAVPKLEAHLDLLHAARALWKLRLGSVRLVELERHVLDAPRLGWHRENDVSSALIPQFYFDYLRGGPAEPLAAVVRHNQMDLRGLAALFGKINTLLSEQTSDATEIESLDLFGLSRFLQRRGESDRAHSACAQALEIGLPAEFRPQARRDLAQMAKRRGERRDLAGNRGRWARRNSRLRTTGHLLRTSCQGLSPRDRICAIGAGKTQAPAERFKRSPSSRAMCAARAKIPAPPFTLAASNEHGWRRGKTACCITLRRQIVGVELIPRPASSQFLVPQFKGGNRMETSAAKQQAMAGDTVITAEQRYLRTELEQRRERLHEALHSPAADPSLSQLLTAVDTALSRIDHGTFGLCETCHDTIEAERLLADPLVRFCLDHLTSAEQRALESDLSMAARIQRGLLPKPGLAPVGWDVRYHYQPAGMVSGDYVSGKGVAASMLMSHLHATFRSLAEAGLQLDRMVEDANRIFCESTLAGQFATLVVGRAAHDGSVEFVSAGHLPVLHIQSDGATPKDSTGVPLGMFCNTRFPVHRLTLAHGDTLFLYTDGLTEAPNRAGAEYGLHRIRTLAARHPGIEPAGLISKCLEDLQCFAEGLKQPDDLTLLAVQRAE